MTTRLGYEGSAWKGVRGVAMAESDSKSKILEVALRTAISRFIDGHRAPRTRTEYEKAILYVVEYFGIRSLEELLKISGDDLIRYRNDLQGRGKAPATIRIRLSAMSGLFTNLMLRGMAPGNPADSQVVKRLPVSDVSRTEGLSHEEVDLILKTCDGSLLGLRDRALLMMLYYEGLRRCEVSRLNYRDLTAKSGLLTIRQAKNNEYAEIRMSPEVFQYIEKYLNVLNRRLRKPRANPEDPVFCSLSRTRFGSRLDPTSVYKVVKVRASAAEIPRPISPHSWRHTCTTHGLQAGVPLHQVQRHLRHKDVKTTLRYDRERDVRRNPMVDEMAKYRRALNSVSTKL